MTAAAALDRVFASFYARRPVTATFTGLHDHDDALPDWSPEGLRAAANEMRALRGELDAAGRVADAEVRRFPDEVDLALADGCLEIQIAEHEHRHFYRGNPALWTGEAIFGIVSLVTRPFAPIDGRLSSAAARLARIPAFLDEARRTLESSPAGWRSRALGECQAAEILFDRGLPGWAAGSGASEATGRAFAEAATPARDAFRAFATWLQKGLAVDENPVACGEPFFSLLVRRGHWCTTPLAALAEAAAAALDEAHRDLEARVRRVGAASWPEVEAKIAAARPSRADYLPRFAREWQRFRAIADEYDLVSWPDAPIRYVPIPEHTREAAPLLYYLFYRSPAPFDPGATYDYVVSDDLNCPANWLSGTF